MVLEYLRGIREKGKVTEEKDNCDEPKVAHPVTLPVVSGFRLDSVERCNFLTFYSSGEVVGSLGTRVHNCKPKWGHRSNVKAYEY